MIIMFIILAIAFILIYNAVIINGKDIKTMDLFTIGIHHLRILLFMIM